MFRVSFIILLFLVISDQVRVPGEISDVVYLDFQSEIGREDNPYARNEYEISLLADPETGTLPPNIRGRELRFQHKIPSRIEFKARRGERVTERSYRQAGPFNVGGRTRAAIIDIRNENTLIAGGVSGGIWKSVNGGTSWAKVNDPDESNSVTCMTQDTRPGKENIMYFATGELTGNSPRSLAAPYRGNGVFKSIDGGDSWQILTSTDESNPSQFGSQFQYAWNIITNPFNYTEDEIFLAAFGGILRSIDGGNTWSRVLGERLFNQPADTDLNEANAPCYTNILQNSDGYYFASLSRANCSGFRTYINGGIYFSTDGTSWINITPPPFTRFRERTVMASFGNDTYFLTQGPDELVTLLKYRLISVIDGQPIGTWTDLSENIPNFGGEVGDYDSQSSYNMLISVHPQDPNVIYIGGTNLYRSTDGFTSSENTKWIGGYHPDNDASRYTNHHPDQHLVLYYPSNPDRMLSYNDGGVRLTTNNRADSVQWITLNNGFITSQFYHVNLQMDEPTPLIIGGMQDNGVYLKAAPTTDPPPSWNRMISGDGGPSYITNGQFFYYTSIQNGQIYRMTLNKEFGLTSFARVDPIGGGEKEGQKYLFINPYILDPLNNNRMFLAGGDVIWRNNNVGQVPGGSQKKTAVNWDIIEDTHLNEGTYTAITKSRRSDLVYAGGWLSSASTPMTYLVRITNASERLAEDVTFLDTEVFPFNAHLICIAIDPEDDNHLIVVFSNYNIPSLFESHNGGVTFTDISGNLEEQPNGEGDGPSIRWAEIVPTVDGQLVFVGTSVGLFSTDMVDGNSTVWVKESPDQVGISVVPSLDYRDIDGKLIVGTHGNGVFEVNIEEFKTVDTGSTPVPGFEMTTAYPNPMQDHITFTYQLPQDGTVRIDIFNSLGQIQKNLLWAPQYAGSNSVTWYGTNSGGSDVRNGIYYCKINYKGTSRSKKIILIR